MWCPLFLLLPLTIPDEMNLRDFPCSCGYSSLLHLTSLHHWDWRCCLKKLASLLWECQSSAAWCSWCIWGKIGAGISSHEEMNYRDEIATAGCSYSDLEECPRLISKIRVLSLLCSQPPQTRDDGVQQLPLGCSPSRGRISGVPVEQV